MATKTITLELDAYDRLRRAKRSPRESFSSVVRRAHWEGPAGTGPDVLASLRSLLTDRPDSFLSEEALDRIAHRALHRPVRETSDDRT
jgi:hypothetical protein